jgi:diaminohydroxyphosphoribosylaminopyrimidine deaminase / 5-amino-6-(5-phosphoribosylamino)uracil reductase
MNRRGEEPEKTVNAHDTRFMEHAFALARKATGLASPNPLVGCVIVNNGEIVGQGFHEYDGRSHAEVLAIRAAGEKSRGATLYVTLEPCNHTGRTGPCSDAIIAAGIARVVAAMQDPNPAVAGRGFEKLRAAGIEVHCGLLEAQALALNESFACWILTQKPFVTLKSALTLDGQLAWPPASAKNTRPLPKAPHKSADKPHDKSHAAWITSEESRVEVHRMRHASDALLTGIGTILIDDPLLTDRSGLPRRRRLLRVILDTKLRLTPDARIVKTLDDDLLVVTSTPLTAPRARKLQEAGVDLLHVRRLRNGPAGIDLQAVLAELGRRDILSVMLEAGPILNGAALTANVVHKLVLFYAPKIAGGGALPFAKAPSLHSTTLRNLSLRQVGADFAVEGYLQNVYRNY